MTRIAFDILQANQKAQCAFTAPAHPCAGALFLPRRRDACGHFANSSGILIKRTCVRLFQDGTGGSGLANPTAYDEVIAYEYLSSRARATVESVSAATVLSGLTPSQALSDRYGFLEPEGYAGVRHWMDTGPRGFDVSVWGASSWPRRLLDSRRPSPVLYHRGNSSLLCARSVAIIGSRRATEKGRLRAARLARELTAAGIGVATGLAEGIDTAAAEASLSLGGRPIAVIGTPVDACYPKGNWHLQQNVADLGLVVSQVPFFRYAHEHFEARRGHFPERNELMAALTDATVIVEAGDRSGTLVQARFCLDQGRPLFLMRSCVENLSIRWPVDFLDKPGVHVLDSTDELLAIVYGGF